MNVLQIQQAHYQSGGFAGTARIGMVQLTETIVKHGPVNQDRQLHQLMGHADLVVKAAAEQLALVSIPGWMRLHFCPQYCTEIRVNHDVSGNFKPNIPTTIVNGNNDISLIN